ncbi:MAG TPA: hypothetical protein VLB69_14505 [Rudaea sp.]|nr:hypothetical protein [Rudaea sp.]
MKRVGHAQELVVGDPHLGIGAQRQLEFGASRRIEFAVDFGVDQFGDTIVGHFRAILSRRE